MGPALSLFVTLARSPSGPSACHLRRAADGEAAVWRAGLRRVALQGPCPHGRRQRADGHAGPVVLVREVHGHHGLGVRSHQRPQRLGRLVVGEVARGPAHALPELGGIGAMGEHPLVMVRLEREDARVGEGRHGLGPQLARVRAEAERVICRGKPEPHGVRHVMGGGERLHAHSRQVKRVRVAHQLKGERAEIAPRGHRPRRGQELAVKVIAEDGEPAHVVGVLVREKDGCHAAEVQAQRIGAPPELAPRNPAVHEHAAARPLHHGRVAP